MVLFSLSIGYSFIKFDIQSSSYQGVVVESKENYFLFHTGLENLYVYEKENEREVGDILNIKGKKILLDFNVLESDFDFGKFLNNKGVRYELEIEQIDVTFNTPIRIKSSVDKFLNSLDENTSDIVGKILFNRYSDNVMLENLESLQLFRLVSMSGLFLYAFHKFFTFLFSLIFKRRHAEVVALFSMMPYGVLASSKFNVRKFFIFTILKFINTKLLKKKISYLTLLCSFGIVILIFNKTYAYQDSFLLSFLIPIVIYLIRPYFDRRKKWINSISLSFAIYLLFIPFTLNYYNGVSILSFPLQIILSPLFIFLGVISLLCLYKIPFSGFLSRICGFFEMISKGISYINPTIYIPSFNDYLLFIFICFYIGMMYLFCINYRPSFRYIFISSIAMLLMYCLPIENYLTTSVSFINVGQGDSTLIRKGNTTILIDTGGLTYKDVATDCLIPYLRKNRIYKIDAVMITHQDNDHVGALPSLCENFKVHNVIEDKNLFPVTINGITFNNLNDKSWKEENDDSLVINFALGGNKYLIMGDASIEVENYIMTKYDDVGCDILRVGHHGSNTSTSDKFIKFVDPNTAIISVGSNFYGHPHKTVIDILRQNNVKIRRTDIEGTITYKNYIFM